MNSVTLKPTILQGVVAYDCDDVLKPFVEHFVHFLNQEKEKLPFLKADTKISFDDFTTYDFTKALLGAGHITNEWATPGKAEELKAVVQETNYRFMKEYLPLQKLYPGVVDFIRERNRDPVRGTERLGIIITTRRQEEEFLKLSLKELQPLRDVIHCIVFIGNSYSGDRFEPVVCDLDGKQEFIEAKIVYGYLDGCVRAGSLQGKITEGQRSESGRMAAVLNERPTKGHIAAALNVVELYDDSKSHLIAASGRLPGDFRAYNFKHPWSIPATLQQGVRIIDVTAPTMQEGYTQTLADMNRIEHRDSQELRAPRLSG